MKIFGKETIQESLDVNIDISDVMAEKIDLWTKMYQNEPPWLDEKKGHKTLGLPSSIAGEMARLVTIEMESKITGLSDNEGNPTDNPRADYLNEQYQRVVDKLRIQTEYGLAKGGLVFKPYIDNGRIAVDYVQADNFYPVEFNSSGDLIAAIFPEVIQKGDNIYTRLEYHHLLPNGTYYIANTAYRKTGDIEGLGMPVSLEVIEEWAELEPELNLEGLERPLFSYFKVPMANSIDSTSDLGVSIFSKAEHLIKEADRLYSSILWEYEGTELAIDVALDMIKDMEKVELPEGKERLYRQLDTQGDDFYKVYNPNIRDDSLFNGLNQLLRRIEFNVGLAYGTLSDADEVAKTATEIASSKQRSYATIVDIQKALQVSLEHLIYSMDYLTTFYGLAPKGDYEVSFHWDDSIVVDAEQERTILLQEVAAGLIKPEYYLQRVYGVEEETAIEMLPKAMREPTADDYDDFE